MLKFKCLATGSSGNCYILETENEALIVDVGIPKKEIVAGLNYNVAKVKGVIISHAHKDHTLALKDMSAFNVWQPYENENLRQKRSFGSFDVQSFDLPHYDMTSDEKITICGYLINVEQQKILYMTDFEYCKYNFKKLKINHLIIECNYDEADKDLPNYRHKVLGHCNIDTCIDFIKNNETESLKNVILVHMGAFPYPMSELVKKVKEHTQADVCCASKGLEVDMSLIKF